jgi:hypothetical protein
MTQRNCKITRDKYGFGHIDFNAVYGQMIVMVHVLGGWFAQSHGWAQVDFTSAEMGIVSCHEQHGTAVLPDVLLSVGLELNF